MTFWVTNSWKRTTISTSNAFRISSICVSFQKDWKTPSRRMHLKEKWTIYGFSVTMRHSHKPSCRWSSCIGVSLPLHENISPDKVKDFQPQPGSVPLHQQRPRYKKSIFNWYCSLSVAECFYDTLMSNFKLVTGGQMLRYFLQGL